MIASGRNEVVDDGEAGKNSPFAESLLRLLEQYRGTGVNTAELADKLTKNVAWNYSQTPIAEALDQLGHLGGQFIFHPRRNEARDWQRACEADTAVAYSAFIEAWPASSRLEEAHWKRASLLHRLQAYNHYLDTFPQGRHADDAIDRIEEIEDDTRFEDARRLGQAGLRRFIRSYPDSRHIEAARKELQRLRAQVAEPEAWRIASNENSIPAYERYLSEYPEGAHAAEARSRIASMEKTEDPPPEDPPSKDPPWWKKPLMIGGVVVLVLLVCLITWKIFSPTPTVDPLEKLKKGGYAIGNFVDSVAIYSKKKGEREVMGLVNKSGKLLGKEYHKVEAFQNGYAVCCQSDTFGYINLKGDEIISPQYDTAWGFESNGLAKVKLDSFTFYVNNKNEQKIIEPTMVYVQGGSFTMGSPENEKVRDDNEIQQTVGSFYMGKYEVTQREWVSVMTRYTSNRDRHSKSDSCPVVRVSWEYAQKYIRKLNELTGEHYRLPTEVEWEYAARGGNQRQGYKYAGSDTLDVVGWYKNNSGDEMHPVGDRRANELGLYDMSGNVYEWCKDTYHAKGTDHVIRGGSFRSEKLRCRVDNRDLNERSDPHYSIGFRLARDP
jgi:formylglycine-generating enzyme required for sulfatase activity